MMTIRRMGPSDGRTYRDLRLRALQDAPEAFGSTYELERARPDDLWTARLSDATVSGKDAPLFVLDGAQICGLAWGKLDAEDRETVHLFQMWVAPESRGSGAGGVLLKAVLDWARSVGARRVRLGVTVGDSPATRLYSRHGFVQVGEPEPLREGSSLMAQTMECPLGPG